MKRALPLKSINSFIAVAQTGSMSVAANELHVSHSAISQSIKSLEIMLERPLFDRIGRRVQLNDEGKCYYDKIAPAFEQIVSATEELLASKTEEHLTLNMVNSLALHWWIPRVESFQQYAPDIDIRMSNLIGCFNLDKHSVDAALVHGNRNEWQGYYCEPLLDDELVMVCSSELLAHKGMDTELLDASVIASLLQQSKPIFVVNDKRKDDWNTWCQQNGVNPPDMSKGLIFPASIQAVQATIRRLGILVTHRLFVRDDIRYGLLTEIGHSVRCDELSFFLACNHNKAGQKSMFVLIEWLKREFKK
ncbi:LysR substrate-binding domain-containing protein [Photobacterium damselae]|uniref:LysR substrate-binding domain-containing protein n=1 Tax=Photobacterium damselae TaxID=38293 RepID=UPI001EFCA206|nr:LysR family transcriptional regulator [Photobacterium damselae]MCG9780087.1 LysR family transcriptional regulator [Photobacterium damselae]